MKKKDIKKEENEAVNKESGNEIEVEVVKNDDEKSKKSKKTKDKEIDKCEELKNEIQELKDSLLRRAAEFENYKRRTENAQMEMIKYAAEPFIINMLPIFDDLERSVNHMNDSGDIDSLKKGIQLVFDKFKKALEDQGVKKIESLGKPFDVDLHDALMQQPAEGVEPHTVLQEIEPGYLFKDKVIRHAKVVVSQEVTGNTENNEDENGKDE